MTDSASRSRPPTRSLPPILWLVVATNLLFLWPLLFPFPALRWAPAVLLGGLIPLALLGPPAWLAAVDRRFRQSERAKSFALLLSSLVVVLGGLEALAGGMASLGIVRPHSAMRTMLPEGVEDWRMAHLTADRHRQPDPELLWRPVAREPYNRQRFKGPVITAEKSRGTVRIFSYGDSNTDGPPTGGWTDLLARRLARRPDGDRFQVINAGVTGYSSYQGRLRLARDAPRFQPDLVLISFGWNDLAPALGAPDSSFRPPAAPLLAVQRLLLEYDAFLVARRYWPRRSTPSEDLGPRVGPADYEANLAAMIDTAAAHGGRTVLLTRPHREPESALKRQHDNWRRDVPAYNRVVRRVAGRRGSVLIDIQRRFAGRPELFVDECHFTPAGHHRMAELMELRLSARGLLTAAAAGPEGRASEPAEASR